MSTSQTLDEKMATWGRFADDEKPLAEILEGELTHEQQKKLKKVVARMVHRAWIEALSSHPLLYKTPLHSMCRMPKRIAPTREDGRRIMRLWLSNTMEVATVKELKQGIMIADWLHRVACGFKKHREEVARQQHKDILILKSMIL